MQKLTITYYDDCMTMEDEIHNKLVLENKITLTDKFDILKFGLGIMLYDELLPYTEPKQIELKEETKKENFFK